MIEVAKWGRSRDVAPRRVPVTRGKMLLAVSAIAGYARYFSAYVKKYISYCTGLMSSLHEEFRAKKKNIKLTTVHPYFINTRPDLIKGWHHR